MMDVDSSIVDSAGWEVYKFSSPTGVSYKTNRPDVSTKFVTSKMLRDNRFSESTFEKLVEKFGVGIFIELFGLNGKKLKFHVVDLAIGRVLLVPETPTAFTVYKLANGIKVGSYDARSFFEEYKLLVVSFYGYLPQANILDVLEDVGLREGGGLYLNESVLVYDVYPAMNDEVLGFYKDLGSLVLAFDSVCDFVRVVKPFQLQIRGKLNGFSNVYSKYALDIYLPNRRYSTSNVKFDVFESYYNDFLLDTKGSYGLVPMSGRNNSVTSKVSLFRQDVRTYMGKLARRFSGLKRISSGSKSLKVFYNPVADSVYAYIDVSLSYVNDGGDWVEVCKESDFKIGIELPKYKFGEFNLDTMVRQFASALVDTALGFAEGVAFNTKYGVVVLSKSTLHLFTEENMSSAHFGKSLLYSKDSLKETDTSVLDDEPFFVVLDDTALVGVLKKGVPEGIKITVTPRACQFVQSLDERMQSYYGSDFKHLKALSEKGIGYLEDLPRVELDAFLRFCLKAQSVRKEFSVGKFTKKDLDIKYVYESIKANKRHRNRLLKSAKEQARLEKLYGI